MLLDLDLTIHHSNIAVQLRCGFKVDTLTLRYAIVICLFYLLIRRMY